MIPELLASKDICHIFPTEVAARFWRDWAARNIPSRVVRSDRFVSWDIWIDRQVNREGKKHRPDSQLRLLASRILCSSLDFEYLIPPGSGTETEQFISLVAALLVKLHELSGKTLPPPLARDIRRLEAGYRELLERSNRYEPAFIQDDITWEEPFLALWFPEIIQGYDPLIRRLREHKGVRCVGAEDLAELGGDPQPDLKVFPDSLEEASSLLGQIEQLLHSGISVDAVCITAGDYDRWRDHLTHEAALRGIPLSFRQGGVLGAYAPGRFFRSLSRCAAQNWPLEETKTLLLDRGCRWKYQDVFERIALTGIKRRCISGGAGQWSRALSLEGDQEALKLWKRLTSHVRKVVSAAGPEELRESFFGFLDLWLQRDHLEHDEYAQVFDYCLDRLSGLCGTAEELGLDRIEGLYSLWMRDLQQTRYVPQEESPGIPVYPYGLSAGMFPKYHAVVGLSQDACSIVSGDIPFFSDASLSRLCLGEDDRSAEVLGLTELGGNQVELTASWEGFSGPAMVPVQLVSRAVDASREGRDAYELERSWWACSEGGGDYYPMQREGFSYAQVTHLAPREGELFDAPLGDRKAHAQLLEGRFFTAHPGMVSVTSYSIDTFTKCRFSWVFGFLLKLEEFDFSPGFIDPREEGTLMHACLQEFYTRAVGIGRSFTGERMDAYRREMKEIIDQVLSRAGNRDVWLIPGVLHQLKVRFQPMMEQFFKKEQELFDRWICSGLEVSMNLERPGSHWRAAGRVDRISRDPEDERAVIIDYKRSRPGHPGRYADEETPPPSWQLPFYALLLGEDDLSGACFYALREGAYIPALDTDRRFPRSTGRITDLQQFSRLLEELTDTMDRMAGSIIDGDYRDDPRGTGCKDCRDRMLCRRRYHVR